MKALLERLKAADEMPLSDKELRYWRTVMPQTTNWLEPEEKAEACATFEAEIERLSREAA